MAEAGKIFNECSTVEISEDGTIWLIVNNFYADSIIMEMETVSNGLVSIEDYDPDEYGVDYDYAE